MARGVGGVAVRYRTSNFFSHIFHFGVFSSHPTLWWCPHGDGAPPSGDGVTLLWWCDPMPYIPSLPPSRRTPRRHCQSGHPPCGSPGPRLQPRKIIRTGHHPACYKKQLIGVNLCRGPTTQPHNRSVVRKTQTNELRLQNGRRMSVPLFHVGLERRRALMIWADPQTFKWW